MHTMQERFWHQSQLCSEGQQTGFLVAKRDCLFIKGSSVFVTTIQAVGNVFQGVAYCYEWMHEIFDLGEGLLSSELESSVVGFFRKSFQ